MARTAPAPNIPAIPGMNPGIFVMGGGGGGGSGSGKGRKGAGGEQGADGENAGDGAEGGGANAGACGQGTGGSCPNPTHGAGGTAAGDPIDPMSGRVYTVASTDLALPGLIPFVLTRSYSSDRAHNDIGLGWGWTHSMGWVIHQTRRAVRIFPPGASRVTAPLPAVGESVMLPIGKLRRHAASFTLEGDGRILIFSTNHDNVWRLSKIGNARQQTIELVYEKDRLVGITDSVGRRVRVRRHRDGHIAAFEAYDAIATTWKSFWHYDFDSDGNLITATDALGHAHRYAYDADHRLVRRQEPGGLVAEFIYDDTGRCIETWCHHEQTDWLDPNAPSALFDGHPAKGALHVRVLRDDDFAEVISSTGLRRLERGPTDQANKSVFAGGVHTYARDSAGQLMAYEDALGSKWSYERNDGGQPLALVDPTGAMTVWDRDEYGRVTAMHTAAGQTARYTRDQAGALLLLSDQLGDVVQNEYDDRGLLVRATLPNGGVTTMQYDDLANRTSIVEPNGARTTIHYDFFGSITGFVENGVTTTFEYDAMARLTRVQRADGSATTFGYDADGNRNYLGNADGTGTRLRWQLGVVVAVERPDQTVVRYQHDRELALTRIVNEAGEEHILERDSEGRVSRERTFDGRVIDYELDLLGRVIQIRHGDHLTAMTYDPHGRVTQRAYGDDRVVDYEYDEVGRLVRVQDARTSCSYRYDQRGRICQEVTVVDNEATTVNVEYDTMGHATKVIGPAGTLDLTRDIVGRPTSIKRDGRLLLEMKHDDDARKTRRVLPTGAEIVDAFSTAGVFVSSHVFEPNTAGADDGQPQWVGSRAGNETYGVRWNWSATAMLESEERSDGSRVEYVRDVNGRIKERRDGKGLAEVRGYDATGNLYEPATKRTYGPGGRLLSCGPITYNYDERGRVVERREAESSWRYEWRDDDLLSRAIAADGRTVSFVYDAFGRLLLQEVVDGTGTVAQIKRLRWWADTLIEEHTEDPRTGQVDRRHYVAPPESLSPLLELHADGNEVRHLLRNPQGAPLALVDNRGQVVSEGRLDGFGRGVAADSRARHHGQWADEATGLIYNRHRFFDPATTSFLSPEPMGIAASLKSYAYGDNFVPEAYDPDGLAVRGSTMTGPHGPGGARLVRATGQSDGSRDLNTLHPAVAASLPPSDANTSGRANDSRGLCAEPDILSNHLYNWERDNPPATCNPPDPNWQGNLQSALGQIDPDGGIRSGTGAKNYPACENCGQMVARLHTLAGMNPPGGILSPGTGSLAHAGHMFNPSAAFVNNPANAGFSGIGSHGNAADWPGAPATLGTWTHNGTQFVRHQ